MSRVRRLTHRVLVVVVAFVSLASGGAASAQEWPREQAPAALTARKVDLPTYQLKTLSNGLQVLVVLHHEQPAVSFRLIVRAGAVQEPADRPGVAAFVAALLNLGTATKSAEQIATIIDSAGGVIGVGAGNELSYVNGAIIKDQTDLALGLMADIVQNPAFSANEITLHRRQALSGLQVALDDPDSIADMVFDKLIFGAHPYGRPSEGTSESLARITQADLVSFHRTLYVPNNSILAIVGDLSADEAFQAAERAFGSWARRDVPAVKTADAPPATRRVVVVDRPGSTQTEIRIGHLSIARTNADYLPLELAVRILGGEGANRLFGVLRSERGLTYGASASLRAFKISGLLYAETDTRSSSTGEALRLTVDEFARLQRENVHPAELSGAQDFISGHFPLSIETPAAIAEEVLLHLFYGQSLSEIDTYLDRVRRVTPADIQRVARAYLKTDQLSIVLVGDAASFISQLRAMGFNEFDRIPLADLDLDSPTLRRAAGAVAPARRGN